MHAERDGWIKSIACFMRWNPPSECKRCLVQANAWLWHRTHMPGANPSKCSGPLRRQAQWYDKPRGWFSILNPWEWPRIFWYSAIPQHEEKVLNRESKGVAWFLPMKALNTGATSNLQRPHCQLFTKTFA